MKKNLWSRLILTLMFGTKLNSIGLVILKNEHLGLPVAAVFENISEMATQQNGPCFAIIPYADPFILDSKYSNPSGNMYFFNLETFDKDYAQAIEKCNQGMWKNKLQMWYDKQQLPFYSQYLQIAAGDPNITFTITQKNENNGTKKTGADYFPFEGGVIIKEVEQKLQPII